MHELYLFMHISVVQVTATAPEACGRSLQPYPSPLFIWLPITSSQLPQLTAERDTVSSPCLPSFTCGCSKATSEADAVLPSSKSSHSSPETCSTVTSSRPPWLLSHKWRFKIRDSSPENNVHLRRKLSKV